MATVNPFDLLGDDDNDDLSQLIAAQQQKIVSKKAATPPPAAPAAEKMPSKPFPPSQAVREAKSNAAMPRGSGRGGRGGGSGQSRNFGNENGNEFARSGSGGGGGGGGGEDGDSGRPSRGPYGGPRQPFRGGRDDGFGTGEVGGEMERPRRTFEQRSGTGSGYEMERPRRTFERRSGTGRGYEMEQPRRTFERRSGTGRGYEMKRDGAGRGNWGSATDDSFTQETEGNVNVDEKIASPEKHPEQEDATLTEMDKENKGGQTNEAKEKEKEDKEMTLEEYEKIREEKRKALLALKTEERKVEIDKELKSMQQLSLKKENDVFIKLGSDKEKKKESTDKDEKAKKSLSINEFLKPAEGERYYGSGGRRGRGRGRGDGGSFRGGFGGGANATLASAPSIEDTDQFPTLGGK